MNDLISIIMPVKDGEKYIQEALDCIKKQNMNVEIIVVDDGKDKTTEIAKNAGCIVIKNDVPIGPIKAKNQALKIAKGEYILFHDSDDYLNEGALLHMYDELKKDSSAGAVMAKVQDFFSPDISQEEKQKTILRKEPYWGLLTGATLIKKETFDKIGFFDESIDAGENIDLQMKMTQHGLILKKIDYISSNRRIHDSNFGKQNRKKEYKSYADILRSKMLKRSNNPEKQQNNTNSLGGG